MSKIALYLALAGAGTLATFYVLVANGVFEGPGSSDSPAPAPVVSAPDALTQPPAESPAAPLVADPVIAPEPSEALVDTADAPDPTIAPVDTADAPEPTAAPVDTADTPDPTVAPADAADAPEPPQAPVDTADAPEPTTAPVDTADAPEPPQAPVDTADAPEPTTAPVDTADAPEPPQAPVDTTDAPEPTTAPVDTADTPDPTTAPVDTADAPDVTAAPSGPAPVVAPAEAPSRTVDTPAPKEAPAEIVDAPPSPDAPVETSSAPARAESAPPPEAETALLPLLDPEGGSVIAEPLLEAETNLTRPSFDMVRTESDGFALIAGGGAPGSKLEVLVNGEPAETLEVGRDGNFSTFLNLPPDQAAVISLRMTQDETTVLSEDEVLVAPLEIVAAEATTTPAPGQGAPAAPVIAAQPAGARTVPVPDPAPTQAPLSGDALALASPDLPAAPRSSTDLAPVQTSDVDPDRTDPVGTRPAPAPAAAPEVSDGTAPPPEAGPAPDSLRSPGDGDAPARPGRQPAPVTGVAGDLRLGRTASDAVPAQSASPGAPPSVSLTDPASLAPPDPADNVAADPAAPDPVTSDPAIIARTQSGVADAPVAPPSTPTVMLSTPRGVEALSTAPLSPGDVALDSISYDGAGDVLLSGRGKTAAFVRIYLDNSPITTSRIREDGRWRVQLPEVDTGTYTLRVDQIDARGQVLARVESPFLRESTAVLERVTARNGGAISSITIQPGNTLWGISRERYGEGMQYVRIFEANRERIRDPDLIYPGQIFALPETASD